MAKENETKPGKEREDYIKRLIAGDYSTKAPDNPPAKREQAQEAMPPDDESAPGGQENKREPVKDTKRKRTQQGDYETLFLIKSEIRVRKGTYITDEFYRKIVTIIHITSNNDKIGVSNYINNVLNQHFEAYEEEIKRLLQIGYESIMNK